jgi:methionine synthase II (cobalamin-independent)
MLKPTIAGSFPNPVWLAKPRMLWEPRQSEGEALVEAKNVRSIASLGEKTWQAL